MGGKGREWRGREVCRECEGRGGARKPGDKSQAASRSAKKSSLYKGVHMKDNLLVPAPSLQVEGLGGEFEEEV